MPILSIPAHFDGAQIKVDEDVTLSKDSRLIVTVIDELDQERADFLVVARSSQLRHEVVGFDDAFLLA